MTPSLFLLREIMCDDGWSKGEVRDWTSERYISSTVKTLPRLQAPLRAGKQGARGLMVRSRSAEQGATRGDEAGKNPHKRNCELRTCRLKLAN